MREILSGLGASAGVVEGLAVILRDAKDAPKMKPGCIIVAKYTNPTVMPLLIGASAIITDIGGVISHAAIVAREMGIPAVVGTEKATITIQDGQIIRVDGNNGKVYLVSEEN